MPTSSGCRRTIGPAPGSGLADRVRRRLVEAEEREQVGDLLRRELLLDLLGHERDLARLHSSTWPRGIVSSLPPWIFSTTRSLPSSASRPVRTRPSVGGDGGGLVARADDQAGVEDVGDELVEVVAAVRGDVRADVLPLAVDLVALGAELVEDGLAGDRIAGRPADRAGGSGRRPARAAGCAARGSCPRSP